MSSEGRGKTAEAVKIVNMMASERIGAATVYYNGQSATTASGYGLDTDGFDEVVISINYGTFTQNAAATSSCAVAILESDTDNPMAASAISGASFTNPTSSTDETQRLGSLVVKDYKRYLFARVTTANEPLTIDLGIQAILGKAMEQPTSNTLDFDLSVS